MSLYQKIRGTLETIFQLGASATSPQIKANGSAIELRDGSDAAFVIGRGLDPVAANDFATKNYVDTGALGGAVRAVRFAIGTGASQPSTTIIPANAQILDARVEVTTPYSGGATIAIGRTGSTSLLLGTTDNNPQSANNYDVQQDTAWGASPLAVLATIGGAPAAGAATVLVLWCTPTA